MISQEELNFNALLSIAQSLIIKDETENITQNVIAEKIEQAASIIPDITENLKKNVKIELIRRYSLWIGKDTTLADNQGHKPWLTSIRRKEWRYWHRYQQFLEQRMSIHAVDALDESTNEILGLLEDPKREGSWDRRGLVVGHVQSGKTGNYTGLICKAADAGYKIIIVLAGLHNNLRSQTQIRLEEGFLGYETSALNDSRRVIGVGGIDSDPSIRPNCATNRSDTGDFSTKVEKHLAITPEERPWLFVIKKNKTILEKLIKWIRARVADSTSSDGRPIVSNLPLLLIDDEADNASVDTGEQSFNDEGMPEDDDYQPKAINSRIRKILHSFSKKAYVGYTATPFANIFIHRKAATNIEGPDLFPQSFIINLAAPSNYIGPTRVFGSRSVMGERIDGLPLVRHVTDHVASDTGSDWMPPSHKISHIPLCNGQREIPESLRKAIYSFILACAARSLRGDSKKHCSMLVHVTRFNSIQEEVRYQVDSTVRELRQIITRNLDSNNFLHELHNLWCQDFIPTSELLIQSDLDDSDYESPDWGSMVNSIKDVLMDIQVKAINGTAKDALDYADNKETGLKVIAIGGDKLARGLTLEGLCTSYFVRTSKMYDTLMQMGRWFGYRPNYIDLCRLYTTSDLIEWFGHIADAAEELREEFEKMAMIGSTPENYGLKVQSHPTLMVTSPLKMRTSKTFQLTFSGDLLETIAFHKDEETLKQNLTAAENLFKSAGEPEKISKKRKIEDASKQMQDGFLWENVRPEVVIDFFNLYKTHPAARKVNSSLIVEFIQSMVSVKELTNWTVYLMGGGEGESYNFAGQYPINRMIKRSARDKTGEYYSIGRLLSPQDEGIDLDQKTWDAALELTRKIKQNNYKKSGINASIDLENIKIPSGPAIRRIIGMGAPGIKPTPEKGLLLIYPLNPKEAGLASNVPPVIAFGVRFPDSSSSVTVSYKVDHLLWEGL